MQVAILGEAQDEPRSPCAAGKAANEGGVENPAVHKCADARQQILGVPDDEGVDFVEVEFVREERDVDRVFRLADVEDEADEDARESNAACDARDQRMRMHRRR